VEINVQFHLFQEVTNQFTAVIVSDNTNQMIQEMIDIPEMIEVQDIPEMIEVQDIPEMIEVQDLHLDKNLVEIILDLTSHEVINF
jgi:hypothetical protein